MRMILFVPVICLLFFACTKDSSSPVGSTLTGKWVLEPGNNPINDTLIFYTKADSAFFFDKSVYFQVNMAVWTTDDGFRYNYSLDSSSTDSLRVHRLSAAPGTWLNVYFNLVKPSELQAGDFRGQDAAGTIYTYRKVE
ncbi:MAG TPA: hypothetical protein VG738_04005 [Chitinophagaceae bacterium]|nr:hypothetical protein [Chitinophagaceae bacterium]